MTAFLDHRTATSSERGDDANGHETAKRGRSPTKRSPCSQLAKCYSSKLLRETVRQNALNLFANEIVIQSPKSSSIAYEKYLLNHPDKKSYIKYLRQNEENQNRKLYDKLKTAQFHYLKGDFEIAMKHFSELVERTKPLMGAWTGTRVGGTVSIAVKVATCCPSVTWSPIATS